MGLFVTLCLDPSGQERVLQEEVLKVTEVKKRLWMIGWSQDSLVRQTGRSKSEVSMVLNGYRHTATIQEAIAAAVGVPVVELFGEWAYSNNRKGDNRPPQVDGHSNGKYLQGASRHTLQD